MLRGIEGDDVFEEFLSLASEARALAGIFPSEEDDETATISGQRLHELPSALEFLRIVNAHLPCIIEGLPEREFPRAWEKWQSTSYLCKEMGLRRVKVALTPNGRADDIALVDDEQEAFLLPHEEPMTFDELIRALHDPLAGQDSPVAYLQSQDSNLTTGDFDPLLKDLQWSGDREEHGSERRTDVAWATEAFGMKPEATNIWVGSSRSVSSMHKDHYENVFAVFRGRKRFYLYPPWEAFFVEYEKVYPVYRWTYVHRDGRADWKAEKSDAYPTPWVPIDPCIPSSAPRNRRHELYTRSRPHLPPIAVTVEAGEALYLPSGWYHAVMQEEDDGGTDRGSDAGVCLCVNWWYDVPDNAMSAWSTFATNLSHRTRGLDVETI